jgi:hypothetical protein
LNSLTLALPRPTPLQSRILASTAKRRVICCGRRAGKTHLGALMAAQTLLKRQKVLIASTSQDQSDVFWRYTKKWLAPLFRGGLAKRNETKREVEFGDGLLKVKTGRDADVLRGFDADLLILDECAYLEPEAWYEVGAPMMADRNGTAVFLSTPVRKNWFFVLYQRAVADATGRWAAYHATTLDNPHLSREAVAELVGDMTEDAYRQEILAEFLEGQGQVFRNIQQCATAHAVEPYPGNFCMGVDTAQRQDYTVAVVMDTATRTMVEMLRFNNAPWAVYRERIKALAARWNVERIVFETNSIGGPNFEALAADGLPVLAFETTPTSKPPLIQNLALAFERKELAILDNPILLGELGAYEYKVSATGRPQYSAPEGLHDDTVVGLALAWHGVAGVGPLIF